MINRLQRWLRFNWMYFGSPPWDTGVTPPELVAFIATHSPGKALDLGCGTGTNLISLARAGWSVVGIDFALKAVSAARKKLAAAGVSGEVLRGDVTQVDPRGAPFDLVLDIGCYHGLPEASRPLYRENLFRLLAARGTFLIYLHLIHEPTRQVGVAEEEIAAFGRLLSLKSRQDSQDRFGRPACWLEFEKLP